MYSTINSTTQKYCLIAFTLTVFFFFHTYSHLPVNLECCLMGSQSRACFIYRRSLRLECFYLFIYLSIYLFIYLFIHGKSSVTSVVDSIIKNY